VYTDKSTVTSNETEIYFQTLLIFFSSLQGRINKRSFSFCFEVIMENQPLPTGIVTFLFTDIQGSTSLWESRPDLMADALRMHNAVLRQAIQANHGAVFKVVGDAFQAAFASPSKALNAAVTAQRGLATAPWNELGPLKVRMGLHAGEAELDPESDEYLISHTKNRVARIMSAGHGGQILISSAVMELLGERLPPGVLLKDMGEHYLKGLLQPEHLFQVLLPDWPADFPPLMTEDPHSNLPIPATPFLNRVAELENITRLLGDPDCRLITLTGIGGSGKTRLAMEAARQGQLLFRSVYFAGLATITSLHDLILHLAEVIEYSFYVPPGVQLTLEEAKNQLLHSLADKNSLLVLDNFEQLSGYASLLGDLMAAAEGIKLIVTSRERLNLPGEWVIEINGLSFPSQEGNEAIPEFAAVQLFVKSAERASRYNVTEDDWIAIARICQLLEGMPLGVEMAAAWVKMISCQEILAEIEGNPNFLVANWRNTPERHHTLQAVFDTSWQLLHPEEREALCRLAVFQGGFRHEAASQVAGAPLSMLATLVDKSLLRRIASGRFEIHPVLRQYAVEKLSFNPTAQAEVRIRHAYYYSDLLRRQVFTKLKGADQSDALAVARAEVQNLRLAFKELIAQRDFKRLDGILPALILFYEMNNQRVETQEVVKLLADMEQALRQKLAWPEEPGPDNLPRTFLQALLGITLAALHHFSFSSFQLPLTAHQKNESLQLVLDLPDTEAKAYAILLSTRGSSHLSVDQRLDFLQQCFSIFKRLNDSWGAALTQLIWADEMNFGNIDIDLARPAYQASLQTFEEAQNRWGQALCLIGLGAIEQKNGRFEEAYRLCSKALEFFSQLGNSDRVAGAHHLLGEIAINKRSLEDARLHFEANLKYFTLLGDKTLQQEYQERLNNLNVA
jgi:predicted ATPase/class 3 adenylate cyclase